MYPRKEPSKKLANKFREVGRSITFQTGEEIFSEGTRAEFLPIVLTGRVKIVRFLDQGKEVIINVFSDGETFAIPPVLDGKEYPATAIAMEETRLLLIYRPDFLRLLDESEEFSMLTMARMSELLRETTASIKNLATPSTEQRIADVLVRVAEKEGGEAPISITLRRQDIGEMAGLTTETTIRAVRKLANQGLLRIVRGKILIEDLPSLRQFSAQ